MSRKVTGKSGGGQSRIGPRRRRGVANVRMVNISRKLFRSPTPQGPRTVLITGAASGFGLELAKRFIARDDSVIATDLHDDGERGRR